jgi:hypothetical protein
MCILICLFIYDLFFVSLLSVLLVILIKKHFCQVFYVTCCKVIQKELQGPIRHSIHLQKLSQEEERYAKEMLETKLKQEQRRLEQVL